MTAWVPMKGWRHDGMGADEGAGAMNVRMPLSGGLLLVALVALKGLAP